MVKPGGCGEHAFSTTYAQFQRDAARYHAARAKAAGARRPSARRRRALGVLGWPVAHSRSPAMQNAALAALGLDGWPYQRLPVPPDLFAETVRALPQAGFVGANVTIPHKEAALALADDATATATRDRRRQHAHVRDGRIEADNTDAPGLLAALGGPPPAAPRSCSAPAAAPAPRCGR